MSKMRLLAVSFIMILQVSCDPMTTNSEEFDGYGYYRWGSNTYTIWNAPTHTLNESDSTCVTKTISKSIDFKVKEQVVIECLEVQSLNKEKGNLFKEMLHSFFHSQSGMYFFASLLELL